MKARLKGFGATKTMARKAMVRIVMALMLSALASACSGPSSLDSGARQVVTKAPPVQTSEPLPAPKDIDPGREGSPADTEMEELPYLPSGLNDAGLMVSNDDVLLASAETITGDAELEGMRGGFMTVGGLEINFGIQMQTLVNGAAQLASALTLDDIIAGQITNGTNLGSVKLTSTDAANMSTFINHSFNGSGIGATVVNSENGLDISNFATLTIDIVGLGQTGANGVRGTQLRPVNRALRQSIIMGLAK